MGLSYRHGMLKFKNIPICNIQFVYLLTAVPEFLKNKWNILYKYRKFWNLNVVFYLLFSHFQQGFQLWWTSFQSVKNKKISVMSENKNYVKN